MRQTFEMAKKAYETVKTSVQEKWAGFKKKFEGTKSEMSQEVMNAKSPEELIALGKKLQQQGEELKAEEESAKQEETSQESLEGEMNQQEDQEDYEQSVREQESADVDKEMEMYAEKKAAEKAEAERKAAEEAAHEEYAKKSAADDEKRIAELRANLNGENLAASSDSSENERAALIERMGVPKNEMFEKYGASMRQAADELVLNAEKMKINDEMIKKSAQGSIEEKKLWDEHWALNNLRNELRDKASWGNGVIERQSQKSEESFTEFSDRQRKVREKYREAAMDDPYVVLKMIEAGEQCGDGNGDGLGRVSERLLSDSAFISEALKLSRKNSKGMDAGWFWRNVSGEARVNRQLFVEAIKANHLNYQFGSPEMKSDPEIKKIAQESGLSEEYLYKG